MLINIRTRVLIAVCCATFASGLLGSSINIALPIISREFNIGAATIPWITTAYFLASAIFLLPGGRLGDIWGSRRTFTYGLLILIAASTICAFSVSELMLILCRTIQGVGTALLATSSAVIVVSTYPPKETGKALGIYLASIYIGLTLGPLIGGVLTEHLGWRSLFLIHLPLGCISLFLLWQLRKVPDKAKAGRFDTIGGLILGFTLFLTIYGLTLLPGPVSIWFILGGLVCLAGFIWWEKRARVPLLNLKLFNGNRIFVFSSIAALISYSSTLALSLIISLYIQYIKGFSPQNAGLILGVLPLVESIFSPIAGRLSDRVDSRYISTSGMILSTTGLGFLYFIIRDASIINIVIVMAVIGLGLALFISPNTHSIMKSVSPSSYGVASATISMARQIGAMLALAIVTVVFSIFIGQVEITPEYYPAFLAGIKFALGIFTILCFIGVFASYARGTRKNSEVNQS